jgi:hypothetical protein
VGNGGEVALAVLGAPPKVGAGKVVYGVLFLLATEMK